MPDKKLTDTEIKKALKICGTYKGKCTDCPAFIKVDRSNCKKVLLGALDIINRLQAENERLKENLNIELENYATEYDNKIKAEAYKEFAESVHTEIHQALESNYKARAERIEKHNIGETDEFISYCEGKIDCLRGLDDLLDDLLQELVGE
jgi:hypothetical protein